MRNIHSHLTMLPTINCCMHQHPTALPRHTEAHFFGRYLCSLIKHRKQMNYTSLSPRHQKKRFSWKAFSGFHQSCFWYNRDWGAFFLQIDARQMQISQVREPPFNKSWSLQVSLICLLAQAKQLWRGIDAHRSCSRGQETSRISTVSFRVMSPPK